MDFIKKNYDKIILCAVLLGVVGFLVFLPFVIAHDQDELKAKADLVTSPRVQPLPSADLLPETNAVGRIESASGFDFSTTNKLFNPIEWKKAPDGTLVPVKNGNE